MRFLFAAGLLLLAVSACATGSEITDGADDDSGEVLTGAGGAAGGSAGGSPNYGGYGSGGEGGDGLGGHGGGVGGGTGGGAGGNPTCDYTSPNACGSASLLGSVAGDEGDPPVVVTGETSEWFQIHITEEDSNIFETDLSYTVTLTPAPGMAYDLFVHEGPQDGGPSCSATAKVGQTQGASKVVSASWDDDQGIGGEDDSVWLNIEVRYVSGMLCGAAGQYTLTIQGNT